jgi:hypothetical protein
MPLPDAYGDRLLMDEHTKGHATLPGSPLS